MVTNICGDETNFKHLGPSSHAMVNRSVRWRDNHCALTPEFSRGAPQRSAAIGEVFIERAAQAWNVA